MSMSRRTFLKLSQAAALAGAGLSSRSAGGEQPAIPIIDTHQHLWDLSRIKLPWLRPPLDRSFTPKDYAEATRGLGIVQAVYMEVAVPRDQRLAEAQYVLELCEDPHCITRAAVLAGSPMEDDFEPWVMQFKDNPHIKGFRGALAAGKMNDERTIGNLRLLGTLGMRFDVNVPPSSLAEAAKLVEQCPDTRFVLDHCGNADPVAFFPSGRAAPRAAQHSPESWKRDMDTLAVKSNIICKISGIVDNVPEHQLTADDVAPIVNHCLDTFGPDRVIFASDWPVCLRGMPLHKWVELLKEVIAGQPEAERRKLFHDNAVGFYGLASDARKARGSNVL
jgi:predicted TIM-barrel fold metal-dependent hydrolase